jgi:hypothetical protein
MLPRPEHRPVDLLLGKLDGRYAALFRKINLPEN